ncbi:MAG: glycosyltransferase family 4 protein [Candidatus Methanofastidiosum sp.]|nr:glycosyltransferase family 4 protein [Methanofastidiosum sp.]
MDNREETKRIVFLIGSMGRGGAERVISILANSYAERGWKVDILMLLNSRCDYELNHNVNVIPICNENKSRIRQLPNWISSIRKYVIENKPDRIVSFIARINIITILSCIGLKQRIIVSERNDPTADGRSIFVRLATHLLYPFVDCVVFQTKWAQSCFSKRIQNKSVIIPNPIHVTGLASNTKEKKIVAVGRLVEQKNHAMLIRAFKKVHDNYPEYKLYIYGEGKLRDALVKQIKELGLTNAVFLPGNVSNIHEKIADAEMFVLSSNYEGLSNALLEAMMMGLPCISTDCAGSNEVIQNGENGILVRVGSEEELIEAIKLLISDYNIRSKISEGAVKSSTNFNADIIVKKWQEIIE